jgi:hypothetical protein
MSDKTKLNITIAVLAAALTWTVMEYLSETFVARQQAKDEKKLEHIRAFAASNGFLNERSNGMWYYAQAVKSIRDKLPVAEANDPNAFLLEAKIAVQANALLLLKGAKAKTLGVERALFEPRPDTGPGHLEAYEPVWVVTPDIQVRARELMAFALSVYSLGDEYVEEGQLDKAREIGVALLAMAVQERQQQNYYSGFFVSMGTRLLKKVNAARPDPRLTEELKFIDTEMLGKR